MSVLEVVKRDAFTRSKTATSGLNLLEKAGIVLKPIVEPVVFRLKPDENACWFSMASNHHLFLLPSGGEGEDEGVERGGLRWRSTYYQYYTYD